MARESPEWGKHCAKVPHYDCFPNYMEKMYYSFVENPLWVRPSRKTGNVSLCQPLSNWLIHPVLQLGPSRSRAAFAYITYRNVRRAFSNQIPSPLLPGNSIFPLSMQTFFFPVACYEKHAIAQFSIWILPVVCISRLEYIITSWRPILKLHRNITCFCLNLWLFSVPSIQQSVVYW